MAQLCLSRRSLLRAALAGVAVRATALANAPRSRRSEIPRIEGVRRTAAYHRRYSVHAAVYLLGLPMFSRCDIGGAYASVELGTADGTQAEAMQFAAGAWPHRAAGLNRFGVLKETIVENAPGNPAVSLAGLMSTSRESNLDEARGALQHHGSSIEITMTRGGSVDGRAWAHTETLTAPALRSWVEADSLLTTLLQRNPPHTAREVEARGLLPFLATMRRAGLSEKPSCRIPFLHGSKQFLLDARWGGGSGHELFGIVRNSSGAKMSEFRTLYAAGDASGLPVRIEYRPRSFLKLTFEAQPHATDPPIPAIIREDAE